MNYSFKECAQYLQLTVWELTGKVVQFKTSVTPSVTPDDNMKTMEAAWTEQCTHSVYNAARKAFTTLRN